MTMKCFRCQEKTGHHQLDCDKEPICYKCKRYDHMPAKCGVGKIKMFGFVIPKCGFYNIKIHSTKSMQQKEVESIKVTAEEDLKERWEALK